MFEIIRKTVDGYETITSNDNLENLINWATNNGLFTTEKPDFKIIKDDFILEDETVIDLFKNYEENNRVFKNYAKYGLKNDTDYEVYENNRLLRNSYYFAAQNTNFRKENSGFPSWSYVNHRNTSNRYGIKQMRLVSEQRKNIGYDDYCKEHPEYNMKHSRNSKLPMTYDLLDCGICKIPKRSWKRTKCKKQWSKHFKLGANYKSVKEFSEFDQLYRNELEKWYDEMYKETFFIVDEFVEEYPLDYEYINNEIIEESENFGAQYEYQSVETTYDRFCIDQYEYVHYNYNFVLQWYDENNKKFKHNKRFTGFDRYIEDRHNDMQFKDNDLLNDVGFLDDSYRLDDINWYYDVEFVDDWYDDNNDYEISFERVLENAYYAQLCKKCSVCGRMLSVFEKYYNESLCDSCHYLSELSKLERYIHINRKYPIKIDNTLKRNTLNYCECCGEILRSEEMNSDNPKICKECTIIQHCA